MKNIEGARYLSTNYPEQFNHPDFGIWWKLPFGADEVVGDNWKEKEECVVGFSSPGLQHARKE